ncbi:sensor histidine kinase [Anaerococcus urinomassiliensis]|uniref:sensor histidine kinase n=1 Tax=Anaerococcus urinomassiliensis TaxID=1745712 RepID=UPI00093D1E74|nr:ATP-binding protein [Anaerococcus urinomassiliensis]
MKNLALKKLKSLALVLILASFLISNFFSIKNKKDAQSNFYENALSFLLLKENEADFLDTLEQFNNTHPQTSVVFVDSNNEIYYNPSKLNAGRIKSKAKLAKTPTKTIKVYDGLLGYRLSFVSNTDKLLALSTRNNISYYLSFPLLVGHLFLGLITYLYINKKEAKNIDSYTSRLKIKYVDHLLKSKDYEEFSNILLAYNDRIDRLEDENYILSSKLKEFTSITSNMKEGFILFDGLGNVELINDSAKTYLGVDNTVRITNLIDDREYSLALREASILKRSKDVDINLNGYNLRIFIDPLSTYSKKAFAMIIIDNTEEKRAEQMRREFSANVTHELKSPLTSINGYAELIATGIAKENDIKKFSQIIYKEGNRLLEIIDDILKISRLDEQNFERSFEEVDIYDVVSETVEKYDRIACGKDLTVTNKVKPYKIYTSKSLFYDLVSNLFDNAIKYNKVSGSITVDYDLGDNSYFLIIKDTGIGMSQADQKRVFERFYVVDKSRKRNQKSTGLGLSIVKHICSYLSYDIKVESKINEGSKFIIEIPLELDREI